MRRLSVIHMIEPENSIPPVFVQFPADMGIKKAFFNGSLEFSVAVCDDDRLLFSIECHPVGDDGFSQKKGLKSNVGPPTNDNIADKQEFFETR